MKYVTTPNLKILKIHIISCPFHYRNTKIIFQLITAPGNFLRRILGLPSRNFTSETYDNNNTNNPWMNINRLNNEHALLTTAIV